MNRLKERLHKEAFSSLLIVVLHLLGHSPECIALCHLATGNMMSDSFFMRSFPQNYKNRIM